MGGIDPFPRDPFSKINFFLPFKSGFSPSPGTPGTKLFRRIRDVTENHPEYPLPMDKWKKIKLAEKNLPQFSFVLVSKIRIKIFKFPACPQVFKIVWGNAKASANSQGVWLHNIFLGPEMASKVQKVGQFILLLSGMAGSLV